MQPVSIRATTNGPGRYFANHPAVYRMSLTGSAGTTLYAVWRSTRSAGTRRAAWITLALLEAAITAGMIRQHR